MVTAVFVSFNLPFIIAGPSLWFDSVISTMKDALFPSGWGIIMLVLPLFFAWRSLWPYFFFVDVILLAVVMQEYRAVKETSSSSQTVSA